MAPLIVSHATPSLRVITPNARSSPAISSSLVGMPTSASANPDSVLIYNRHRRHHRHGPVCPDRQRPARRWPGKFVYGIYDMVSASLSRVETIDWSLTHG